MNNVVCFILGGGKGSRLQPLTSERSKPAVPIGGKYRLIDIPISNCINSGIRRMYLLTQFNSVSLHRHIRETYNFDSFNGGFVEILAAQQTNEKGADWYQGTADAVRKQLRYLQQPGIDYVLILSGDQLYHMDFKQMLKVHQSKNADVTMAALPVKKEETSKFGIIRLEDNGRIEGFLEKPTKEADLAWMKTSPEWIDSQGVQSDGCEYLASMGIYLFNRDTLVESLEKTNYQDFGKEVFPAVVHSKKVHPYLFKGYWEDIGTIRSFYDSQILLTSPDAPFEMHNADSPIFTHARFLPPTQIKDAQATSSIIAEGCLIGKGVKIDQSLIGLRSKIEENCVLDGVVLMGADLYSTDHPADSANPGDPPLGIGAGTHVSEAIVDKNCRIGKNVIIRKPANCPDDARCGPVIIRDGVIVVPRGTILPDGWELKNLEPCKF